MSKLTRFGVSVEHDLLEDFDAIIAEKGYSNRLIGGAIANNHLPEAGNMAKMISRCGFSIEINDTDDKYMIIAREL